MKKLINRLLVNLLSVQENSGADLGNLRKILIIRQHNQLGDLLACVSLFRAIKEKYPRVKITLIVSPSNYAAITKNKLIDDFFVFNKAKAYNPFYLLRFLKILRRSYDAVIVPVTVSISFTSNLMARLSKAGTRIGVSNLNGIKNEFDSFFDRKVALDWRRHPDDNVSDFCLDIVRPFGIETQNFSSEITFDKTDSKSAGEFIRSIGTASYDYLIGIHAGAGKPPNRWPLEKFVQLVNRLNDTFNLRFYFTGSSADVSEINYIRENLKFQAGYFIDRTIPEVAALAAKSDLFITNDTGIMHVAGATRTPQISIFGPTNPFNWAPVGKDKLFIRKSDIIDDISVDEVFAMCEKFLTHKTHLYKKV